MSPFCSWSRSKAFLWTAFVMNQSPFLLLRNVLYVQRHHDKVSITYHVIAFIFIKESQKLLFLRLKLWIRCLFDKSLSVHEIPSLQRKLKIIFRDFIMIECQNVLLLYFLAQSWTNFHHRSDQVQRIFKVRKNERKLGKFCQNVSFVKFSNLLEQVLLSHEAIRQFVLRYDHNIWKVIVFKIQRQWKMNLMQINVFDQE